MRRDGVLPITVETPAGRADVLVDAGRPLAELLAPLAAATGWDAADDAGSTSGWRVTEGMRRLSDLDRTLPEHRVVAGSVLRLRLA